MADVAAPARSARTQPARGRSAGNALPVVIFAALIAVPAVAALTTEAYVLGVVTRVMIFSIAAVALDLLVGYGALVSFGHAAFVGLGAYAVGILAASGIGDGIVALAAAIAVSALFAAVTGAI